MRSKRFLVRHVGNMGDMVFIVPPILETLKKKYPDCHITLVTAWGFKTKPSWQTVAANLLRPHRYLSLRSLIEDKTLRRSVWGERNQSGFCIALMMTNPHVDQLVHYHSTETALDESICHEEGRSYPTWSEVYYQSQKVSGDYDEVFELDFGVGVSDNPIQKAYEVCGLPQETYSNYQLYFTEEDVRVAQAAMRDKPHPRIVLLEGIEGTSTRGWDPDKVTRLEQHIKQAYGVDPMWFGGKHVPLFEGKPLTLRQNIATLKYCNVAIGVLSGPMHFAAAVELPTICLYGDQPLHRAAPAYFLNEYIHDQAKQHRTIMGPTNYNDLRFLKDISPNLTEIEQKKSGYTSWTEPGEQSLKSCVAAISSGEVGQALGAVVGHLK